jgi:hypothetical protein
MSWSRDALVDRQITEWKKRKGIASPVKKSLTITGEVGALGNRVGAVVAQQFGFQVYDREVIHLIVEQENIAEYLCDDSEARELRELQVMFEAIASECGIPKGDYCGRLNQLLRIIGRQGSSVVLGRGGNILMGMELAVRVRVIAPRNLRIQRNAQRYRISMNEAESLTDQEDMRRTKWVSQMLQEDTNDPAGYDLVVSTGLFSVDQAAAMIVMAYRSLGGVRKGMPARMLRNRSRFEHGRPELWMQTRTG